MAAEDGECIMMQVGGERFGGRNGSSYLLEQI